MKKILSITMTIMVIIMSFAAVVSAAPVDDVIQALEDAKVPAGYIEQARSYFADNPLTDEEAAAVVAHIEEASDIAGSTTKVSDLTETQINSIVAQITEAAQVVDMTVSYADGAINVRDASGELIITESFEGAVKQTGFDYSIILYGLVALVLAGASAVVVKKKLASEKE